MTQSVNITICLADTVDVEQIAALNQEDASVSLSSMILEAELRNPLARLLLAKRQERLVGLCDVHFLRDTAQINAVYVRRDCRRQGIGTALLSRAIKLAAERDCIDLRLNVRSVNAAAFRFYEQLGFHRQGYKWGFYVDPGDDAIVMQREIAGL